jgi:S1-C subfamily serine protease
LALSVPLSRFTSRVGGGSAFYVRPLHTLMKIEHKKIGFSIAGRLLIVSAMLVACAAYAEDQVGGIGAWVVVKNHALTIANVLPNTPASKAGLVPGLVVQKIDGIATADKREEDCVAMIHGTVGTTVKLELIDTAHSKTNTVELTRAEIKR